jgi:hypothetical protein
MAKGKFLDCNERSFQSVFVQTGSTTTRERVLATALRLCSGKGYFNSSMRDITPRVRGQHRLDLPLPQGQGGRGGGAIRKHGRAHA